MCVGRTLCAARAVHGIRPGSRHATAGCAVNAVSVLPQPATTTTGTTGTTTAHFAVATVIARGGVATGAVAAGRLLGFSVRTCHEGIVGMREQFKQPHTAHILEQPRIGHGEHIRGCVVQGLTYVRSSSVSSSGSSSTTTTATAATNGCTATSVVDRANDRVSRRACGAATAGSGCGCGGEGRQRRGKPTSTAPTTTTTSGAWLERHLGVWRIGGTTRPNVARRWHGPTRCRCREYGRGQRRRLHSAVTYRQGASR